MKTFDDFTDHLRNMLGEDNPEGVVRCLRTLLQMIEGEHFNVTLGFNARLTGLRKNEIRGFPDPLERGRIRHSIFQFLDELELDEHIIEHYEKHRNDILNQIGGRVKEAGAGGSIGQKFFSTDGAKDTLSGNISLGMVLVLCTDDGRVSEKKFEISKETLIGRDKQCDIVIDDHRISRRHAIIFLNEGEIWVEDPGSRNGTFVDGKRVHREKLRDGCLLQFFDFVFKVEFK